MAQIKIAPILKTWGRALRGRVPSLSIEITKECPLRCPGCYAYEDAHLGTTNLRSLSDFKGKDLVERVLRLVDEYRPLHLSIVGGDPLVRYRELEVLLPKLVKRSHVQIVTSAFRPIPPEWASLPNLQLVVSIDGLEPEHNQRRNLRSHPPQYSGTTRHRALHRDQCNAQDRWLHPRIRSFLVG
jgi:MoaA/NifB/PqqE/SkfB family radical SAM enzyme